MKLLDFIPRKGIASALKAVDRKGIIAELSELLKKAHAGEKIDAKAVAAAVLTRETKVGSTGLGDGVAIPHARIESVSGVLGVFGRSAKPIAFSAVDGAPVSLFFLVISPESKAADYAVALGKVASSVKRPNFCKFLRAAKTPKDIEEIFKDAEEPVRV